MKGKRVSCSPPPFGVKVAGACRGAAPPALCLVLAWCLFSWLDLAVPPEPAPERFHSPVLAEWFNAKANQYFVSGSAPSWLAPPTPHEEPDDWIAQFGSHFRPRRHVHLDSFEPIQNGPKAHLPELVREVLPWFWLAVRLDPHNIEARLQGAYVLDRLKGETLQAEQFLRAGVIDNPQSSHLHFELGRILLLNGRPPGRARHVLERALELLETGDTDENVNANLETRRVTALLAEACERQGDWEGALRYLTLWGEAAPDSERVRQRILAMRGKLRQHPAPKPDP